MSEELFQIIEKIEIRLEKIISENKKLREHQNLLKTENETLKKKLEQSQLKFEELNRKTEIIKLAKTWTSEGKDIHDSKIKINRLVREIDDCIALLNK
ncbi:MAG: hypothetical protein A2275_11395 [Bacteroidetes bacterium RIFOXYA12_FULL_35_11]|nr:MAG: hypothetical protein A2X01_04680 [Bacteroidetes bacterium GWF2_35_48]OFY74345.1 MAG: hypothetical protein A2275_11395 [Bacteroidetes bacterium RIFOXYA12_FULL_35_11]OFY94687.1 MAG: hypothetical protein A2309_02195 [Bacteroidetes bacterium RIFOXYB2_FULL_35_7]OFY98113.1 MAG: hypothetical protein A2491_18015 [Bacteroidetes bacterium RIFOXYC12_FULL_35_7]HBX51997.1 hypothetical protein [Bacteroidales bacterium]